ncbi:MAG: hypothetical protein HW416_2167 [Chloroflexi bacterium]|nr:hypothetical protein [Chloroflexota bacterium]
MIQTGTTSRSTAPEVGDVKLFKKYDVFVVRLQEGFIAMSRWCRHMNGRVVYERDHWRFRCPYHRAVYDRRGDCTGGQPDLNALWLHPLSISNDGHVLVNTDDAIDRTHFEPSQAVSWGSELTGWGSVTRPLARPTPRP